MLLSTVSEIILIAILCLSLKGLKYIPNTNPYIHITEVLNIKHIIS